MAELKAWKRILRRINKTLWLEKRKRNQEAVTALIWEALDFARRRQWHPLQYSCLENPMDGGAWWAAVHVVAKSQTWLSDFPFTFHFHALEKEMATHSSVLAWRIPGTGEPDGLPSMGSHRVRHEWNDLAHTSASWQPIPVFLPGESQGQGNLIGCHLWGRTESDTTEAT